MRLPARHPSSTLGPSRVGATSPPSFPPPTRRNPIPKSNDILHSHGHKVDAQPRAHKNKPDNRHKAGLVAQIRESLRPAGRKSAQAYDNADRAHSRNFVRCVRVRTGRAPEARPVPRATCAASVRHCAIWVDHRILLYHTTYPFWGKPRMGAGTLRASLCRYRLVLVYMRRLRSMSNTFPPCAA